MQMSWGKPEDYKRGAGPPRLCRLPAPNRFLALFHNRQLMRCHYLLSRRQGEQAECMSWSAAVSAASRTGTKQASGNVKKERGGKLKRKEEDGGAGSLSEGLAKDSRKRQVRNGTARTSEGNGPGDQTALERKVPLEPGCDPNSLRSQPGGMCRPHHLSKGTGLGRRGRWGRDWPLWSRT